MKKWTFIHVADMQPGSPKSFRYNPSWMLNWKEARKQILEINPDLLLVGGDLTRDGNIHQYEFEEMKTELSAFPFPVHVVPGNMDTGNKHADRNGMLRADQSTDIELNVTSAQLKQFASFFGPLWWSVEHKGVRFSGFADVVVNSGLPEEVAFWQWAEEQKALPPVKHHVWILHYALFADKPDEPDWDIGNNYTEWYFCIGQPGRGRLLELFKATGADIVISGHIHCHKVTYAGGIRFEIAPATSFGQWGERWPDGDVSLGFLKYDVSDSGIEAAFVPLLKTHDLEGYGPGNHPSPRARDYSLAWEKT